MVIERGRKSHVRRGPALCTGCICAAGRGMDWARSRASPFPDVSSPRHYAYLLTGADMAVARAWQRVRKLTTTGHTRQVEPAAVRRMPGTQSRRMLL
jgi:hypothetical protein